MSFETDVTELEETAQECANRSHHNGEVETETYFHTETPVDVELSVSGEFADLSALVLAVQDSARWTVCNFAHAGERNATVLSLTYHDSVEGVFQDRDW